MKIALVENFGADFVGARLRFAIYLKNNGVAVTAIIPKDGHKLLIEEQGIRVIEVGVNIRGKGVQKKIDYALKLKGILKEEKFDIVHFYRLQPNIIGTFIAGLFTKSKLVNHVTGLGVAFTSKSIKNRLQQFVIKFLYQFNNQFFKPYTIYQNNQDSCDLGVLKRIICIEGSAVNESKFNPQNIKLKTENLGALRSGFGINSTTKVFIFVSRLLKEKGVLELIEGFKQALILSNQPLKLLIVGWSDPENPSAVKTIELEHLIKGVDEIQFLGKRSDVDLLLQMSTISILPTYYREGTPRFLLESMAMGKPIITTNMPGCNHLVPTGENGELIMPKNINDIKNSILRIIDRDLDQLGMESRKLYYNKFSEEKVYSKILKLYNSILN